MDITPNRRLPLPAYDHSAAIDASRIAEALSLIDNDLVEALSEADFERIGRVLLGTVQHIKDGAAARVPTTEAVKRYVADELSDLVGSSPAALDTLSELASALGNDPNFATSIINQLALKAEKTKTETALSDRYTKAEIDALLANRLSQPADAKWIFANKAPPGWIKPTGALINRADFPDLWAFAQTSGMLVDEASWPNAKGCFSKGNGTSTFRLPDLRGTFLRVFDDGAGVDTSRVLGTRQTDAIRSHIHTGKTNAAGKFQPTAWTDAQGYHNHIYLHTTWAQVFHTVAGGPNHVFTGMNVWNEEYGSTANGTHVHNVGVSQIPDHIHDLTIDAFGDVETRPVNTALIIVMKY